MKPEPKPEVHEPFVPSDDEQTFALSMLETAKGIADKKRGVRPMAFLIGPHEEMTIIDLLKFGDWGSARDRDRIAFALRRMGQELKLKSIGLLSDAWLHTVADIKGMEAAGLDPRKILDWSAEARDKFAVKREALFISIETKERSFLLSQFYRRNWKDCPIWEEMSLAHQGLAEGRFTGLLRGTTS